MQIDGKPYAGRSRTARAAPKPCWVPWFSSPRYRVFLQAHEHRVLRRSWPALPLLTSGARACPRRQMRWDAHHACCSTWRSESAFGLQNGPGDTSWHMGPSHGCSTGDRAGRPHCRMSSGQSLHGLFPRV